MNRQHRQQQQNKQHKNKSIRKREGTDGNKQAPYGATRLPNMRGLNLVIPDKMFTRLQYNGLQTLAITVGNTATALRYRPTAVFDVDPLLGGTSVPGFTEMAALYTGYRVVGSKITLSAVGLDARPIAFGIVPLNFDPGASPALATIQSWLMNPYHKYLLTGGSGSPPKILSKYMSTERIFGSKQVYFDDNFTSIVTSVPNNNWFWAIFLVAPGPVVTTNQSTTVDIKISMDIEFFNRKALLN